MLSSSKSGDKAEAKFIARLDVLTERLDTLASTVATTASAMAKKDGEIAALRKELDARDERLADFITRTRTAAGGTELIELREAVAALAKERGSKGGSSTKQIDDLVAKVGLLGQRLETISTTVSTTAAGLAGKEGELASIRKQLDAAPTVSAVAAAAPDPAFVQRMGDLTADMSGAKQQLDGLAAEVGTLRFLTEQRATELEQRVAEMDHSGADAPRQSEEIREMLTALRTKVEELAGLRAAAVTEEQLEQRIAPADESVSRLSESMEALRSTVEQLAEQDHDGVTEEQLEQRVGRADESVSRLSERIDEIGSTIQQLAGLDRGGVTEEQLEQRVGRADEGVSRLSERLDVLGSTVESAVSSLADKERDLAVLHGHFDESSARIESIVGDIRAALAAFPDLDSANVDDLAARLDRVGERIDAFETTSRELAELRDRSSADLAHRIDSVEQQLGTVANEVARAKALWPVALRSLEARLDDVGSHDTVTDVRPVSAAPAPAPEEKAATGEDDLVASLRDSLQAMESVAAEMARASDALAADDDDVVEQQAAAAGGATVVPLRADP